jgi:deoxyribodipyrimidine photolyase-related protein
MWSKKQLGVIPKMKSKDKANRGKYDGKVRVPKLASNSRDLRYIKVGIKAANSAKFRKHPGDTAGFMFPVTHATAKKFLRDFLKNKFKNFGKYQDAICNECPNGDTMFHSLLSSSMNIGLLTPREVLDEVLKVKNIPSSSYEGFVRQLFWREYQRYCYKYKDALKLNRSNYFGNNKSLGRSWYNGTTGILPIDDCIKEAFSTGYLHHIKRLMVIGNFMNLSGISPSAGYRWFMEFSCDSYDWVMYQNVYDMVFFVSGGKTMRKPYISSSNYILKMSDWKCKDSEWCDIWDRKYRAFIKKHKKKLRKFYIRV